MKNTVRILLNGGKKAPSSQVKTTSDKAGKALAAPTDNKHIRQRSVSCHQVIEFIDRFQRLQFSQEEVVGLLSMGVSTMRLMAKDRGGLAAADFFEELVNGAKHKLAIAVNSIHQSVFQIDPRVQDPWATPEEMEAARAVGAEVAL